MFRQHSGPVRRIIRMRTSTRRHRSLVWAISESQPHFPASGAHCVVGIDFRRSDDSLRGVAPRVGIPLASTYPLRRDPIVRDVFRQTARMRGKAFRGDPRPGSGAQHRE